MKHACVFPSTLRLQRASTQMLFAYEGTIQLQIPKQMCSPLRLISLNASDIQAFPGTCDTCSADHLSIQLCVSICDAAGRQHLCSARLELPLSNVAAPTAHICYDAAIRLLHSHQAGPNAFLICAQILLTQAYACTSDCKRPQRCCQYLPLYPHLTGKCFGKSGEKHNSSVIL